MQGSLFLALEFPRALIKFCRIFRSKAVLSGNSKEKVTNLEIMRGLFKKIMSSITPVWMFSGVAQHHYISKKGSGNKDFPLSPFPPKKNLIIEADVTK